jgi:hypothetical protein
LPYYINLLLEPQLKVLQPKKRGLIPQDKPIDTTNNERESNHLASSYEGNHS